MVPGSARSRVVLADYWAECWAAARCSADSLAGHSASRSLPDDCRAAPIPAAHCAAACRQTDCLPAYYRRSQEHWLDFLADD